MTKLGKVIYGNLPFEEAEKYFKGKIPITKKQYQKLAKKYKNIAFTVSNYSSLEIVNSFYIEVLKAIEEGTTLETFIKNMDDFLKIKGYEGASKFQADNIFRTNIQTAYQVGHYEQMTDESVLKSRPYWRYEAVDDDATRPTHLAMDGLVYRADDPFWDVWYPPNGYRCRCTVSTLSKIQVEEMGIKVQSGLPESIVPDEGFANNPAKVEFEPDISKYPQSLQTAYKRLNSV